MTDEHDHPLVGYACADGIAAITLNRPEKLNAFSDELVRHLARALRRFDADPEARIAILHGAGRAFSSGADVHQRQLRSREELKRLGGPQGEGAHAIDLLTRSVNWKPVVAAVHGYVLGMATGLMLECDLVVAEAGTRMQITETPRGLGAAKYWALLDFCGAGAFGTEVALTGRYFTAEEAHAAGILHRVAPAGSYLAVARELAATVAANPPLSVRSTVRTRRWYMEKVQREAMMQSDPWNLHLTEDFAEAARAFAEKRTPGPFKGR
ncbi:MAG: enoyl-CoA hydratase/isomerase family protein [Acetobacteraceae bacterium]|nr:enoyl-CoA hydratase/isomerase family protein [Acetobacteraceae bacterium]